MVVDLTQDSDSDSPSPEVLSRQLLNTFIRPLSAAPSLNRPKDITGGPTLSSRPQSKGSNVSVVITLQRPSSSQSSTTNRKRSSSSADDVNNALSQRLAATNIPEHHGLSNFYHVDSPEELKRPYRKFKKGDHKASDIPRPIKKYIPPSRQDDGKSASDRLKAIYNRKLSRIDGPPIHFVAGDMAHRVDFNFDFIDAYKLHDGVEVIGPEFLCGCNCTRCDRDCDCLLKEQDSNNRIIPYQPGRQVRTVLRANFINKKTEMIRECSSRCACSDSKCWNHVIYRGRQIELEIFQTQNRGFGIRSPNPIEKGQFIDIYVGELIEKSTSNAREEAIDTEKHSSYLFSLDYYQGHEDYQGKDYVVDGRKFGSITRFMNHSCNPTCKMFTATQTDDKNVYQLAFFAVRDIPAGTELTFDYHPRWKKKKKIDPNATKCLCGEPNCRGQLWPTRRKTTRIGEDMSSSDDEFSEEDDSSDEE